MASTDPWTATLETAEPTTETVTSLPERTDWTRVSLLLAARDALLAILVVAFTLGLLMNAGVLVLLCRSRLAMYVRNTLLANLTLADLLNSAMTSPVLITCLVNRRWPFGVAGCSWFMFASLFFGTVSAYTQAAIAIERFCYVGKIASDIHQKQESFCKTAVLFDQRNRKYSLLVALGAWLAALPWTLPPVFGWAQFTLDPQSLTCTMAWDNGYISNKIYPAFFTFGAIALPFGAKIILHCLVYRKAGVTSESIGEHRRRSSVYRLAMRVSRSSLFTQTARQSTSSVSSVVLRDLNQLLSMPVHKALAREQAHARTMLWLSGLSVACWLPFCACALFMPYWTGPAPETIILLAVLPKAGALYNPLVTLRVYQTLTNRRDSTATLLKGMVACCCPLPPWARAWARAWGGRTAVVTPLQEEASDDSGRRRRGSRSGRAPAISPTSPTDKLLAPIEERSFVESPRPANKAPRITVFQLQNVAMKTRRARDTRPDNNSPAQKQLGGGLDAGWGGIAAEEGEAADVPDAVYSGVKKNLTGYKNRTAPIETRY